MDISRLTKEELTKKYIKMSICFEEIYKQIEGLDFTGGDYDIEEENERERKDILFKLRMSLI